MKQFFKIYLWQVISLITGFATMFVVTPYLASNQNYFGIYTFVSSLNLFLSYADFGFLSAGSKFASEAYANGNRKEEERVLGFVFFIMSIVFFLFGTLILVFYFDPSLILTGLVSVDDVKLTKGLFLVFIISLPVMIGNRAIQLIFNIRLQDYLYQRVYSIFNLMKIFSVFVFFMNGEYNLVEYYAFTQILTICAIIIGCIIAKKRFKYDFLALIKQFSFNKEVYRNTKKLAFNSLFVTISWVLYYELDSLVIGRFVGLKEVAIFNICISIMTFARTLYGILYNPFAAKFNHYIARGEKLKLIEIYKKVLIIGLPLSVIPTTILILTMNEFIYSWVGPMYSSSIPIISIMFACYFFTFLSNPTSIIMVAFQDIKSLYLISALIPLIYWVGIIISYKEFGLIAFSIFKLIAFLVSAIFYSYYSKKILRIKWNIFFLKNIFPALITMLLLFYLNKLFGNLLPYHKGKIELFKFIVILSFYGAFGISFYYLVCKEFRNTIKETVFVLFKYKSL